MLPIMGNFSLDNFVKDRTQPSWITTMSPQLTGTIMFTLLCDWYRSAVLKVVGYVGKCSVHRTIAIREGCVSKPTMPAFHEDAAFVRKQARRDTDRNNPARSQLMYEYGSSFHRRGEHHRPRFLNN